MVQRVAATTQWAEQVTIRELELGAGPILPGTQTALVGSGGGAEVWLDGEQMGIVCGIKTESVGGSEGFLLNSPSLEDSGRTAGGGAPSPALLGLMLTGWKPEVRMEESATSESSPSFLRQ